MAFVRAIICADGAINHDFGAITVGNSAIIMLN
jgi:hypothetical protein